MQERQGQIPPGSEFRGQWPQLEEQRRHCGSKCSFTCAFERWGNTFSVRCHHPFWFPVVARICWEGRRPGGNARASPGGCPPSGPAHSHPPNALQADLRGRPEAVSCVFFLMWKIIGQQDSLALELFFSNLCEKLYFNLKELIKDDCHPKRGFIHCSVLAPRAGLGTPWYPVNFPWMAVWSTVHQLRSFWVIKNADSWAPPGPSESEGGGERPANQYWSTVFPKQICLCLQIWEQICCFSYVL